MELKRFLERVGYLKLEAVYFSIAERFVYGRAVDLVENREQHNLTIFLYPSPERKVVRVCSGALF